MIIVYFSMKMVSIKSQSTMFEAASSTLHKKTLHTNGFKKIMW